MQWKKFLQAQKNQSSLSELANISIYGEKVDKNCVEIILSIFRENA